MNSIINDEILLDLINKHEKLIYKIASKFYNVDQEDLYQLGIVGLLKAFYNFKDNHNAKFSTYAYEYINGEMYLALKENLAFKINKETLKLYKAIIKTNDFLTQRFKKIPTITDIALYMKLDEKIVEQTLMLMSDVISLDESINETSDLYNLVTTETPDSDNKILIDESLNRLNKKEKEVINHRYFKDLTQSETAKILGMSQVAVSRAENKSLLKMRSYMLN